MDDPNAKSPDATKRQANGHGVAMKGTKDRVEELGKELGLTEQQKKEVETIFENERKDLRAVMGDKSLNKEQKLKKIDVVLQATEDLLSKVLTPEQRKKYAEIKADIHEDRQGFAEKNIERISEELGLTDKQKKAITPIIENETKDLLAVMGDKSLNRKQKLEKIDVILQATKDRLSKILTPEQQKKYDKIKMDIHEGKQDFAERHIERMSEELGLTDKQKKDITPIIQSEMNDMRAVTSDKSLSKEQKMKKIDVIRQATRERLSKILTPEQMKKYADETQVHAREKKAEQAGQGREDSRQKPADSNSK